MQTAAVIGLLIGWYFSVALGVSVGYHRVLSHASARLHPWLLRGLVFCAIGAGPPAVWAGNHRRHHAHADTPDDPHSPCVQGFWYAHCGWYLGIRSVPLSILYALAGPARLLVDVALRPTHPCPDSARASDVLADPVLRFLSTRIGFGLAVLMQFAVLGIVAAFAGLWVVWAVWLVSLLMYNAGDAVNSVAHLRGAKPLKARDNAGDLPWLTFLALGDNWHNAHHAFPKSVRHGLLPGQLDLSFWFIKCCERLGLAHNLQYVTAEQIEKKRVRQETYD